MRPYNGTINVDTTSATITYIGKAPYNTATSAPSWYITKVDTSSGVVVKAASGRYDPIWDNRASLTYS